MDLFYGQYQALSEEHYQKSLPNLNLANHFMDLFMNNKALSEELAKLESRTDPHSESFFYIHFTEKPDSNNVTEYGKLRLIGESYQLIANSMVKNNCCFVYMYIKTIIIIIFLWVQLLFELSKTC